MKRELLLTTLRQFQGQQPALLEFELRGKAKAGIAHKHDVGHDWRPGSRRADPTLVTLPVYVMASDTDGPSPSQRRAGLRPS